MASGEIVAHCVARLLGAAGKERSVYSACKAVWRTPLDTGARLSSLRKVIGYLDGAPVRASMQVTSSLTG